MASLLRWMLWLAQDARLLSVEEALRVLDGQ
jgi:hypothetical protein